MECKKVHNIFELEEHPQLLKGLKIARLPGVYTDNLPTEETEEEVLKKLEDVCVSEKLFCSFCNTSFEDQSHQRLHYKLDWHRYNLKRQLGNLKPVTEEQFAQLTDDVSSISGSEYDSEDSNDDGSEEKLTSAAHIRTAQSKPNKQPQGEDDMNTANRNEILRLQAARHSKVFFENSDGKILSLHRCLLHAKKSDPEKDEDLIPYAMDAVTKRKWAIVMLGGGHFAAAVFNGNEVLLHKTFHSYTVRAHQGATQSSRDSRSGSSHPKSAGASLRRYNEASLMQHVQEIIQAWTSEIDTCSLIFYRAVGHSKTILFGGRNPSLRKSDPRLRTIPFATRRATFSEVKRVQSILASVQVYGGIPEYTEASVKEENCSEPKKRSPKQNIDRSKARKSPHRPLPGIVSDILAKSSSESDISESPYMVTEDKEVLFGSRLQQFEDTVPQHIKQRKRDPKKPKRDQQTKNDTETFSAAGILLRKKLWAACKLGDTALLANSLQTIQPIEEESEQTNVEKDNIISRSELLKCLNEKVGDSKETLLHIAAAGGHTEIIRILMEAGCDPNNKNKNRQTPYVVSANKETRNTFRRFVADFPEKYDYTKSQIAGPLTEDMEKELANKRRELRKAKREKAKEKKKEEEERDRERKLEEEDRARFLELSDKEKRALLAQKKPLPDQKVRIVSRCFQCAVDITGKVPFEYDIHRFCTMDCLKQHKRDKKLLQQT